MLTKLRIKNFKAWKDTGDLRVAPLTVLFGTNSSGKSSLGHLLLALKQTAASSDRRRAFDTGDESSLIELGTFVDCLHRRDRKAELEFTIDWATSHAIEVRDPLDTQNRYRGEHLALTSTLVADRHDQPLCRRVKYELRDGADTVLSATLSRSAGHKVELKTEPYRLVPAVDRKWPLEPPEKFYRLTNRSLARYQNADFLAAFGLEVEGYFDRLSYLGPLREYPRRNYRWAGNTPVDVGQRGESAIAAILAAQDGGRTLSRGRKQKPQGFAEFIATWLVQLGVIDGFALRSTGPGRKDYEVRVKTQGGVEVALPDVGFGVSQVLPALVQAFYCLPGSTVWLEQPELHLHPRVQAELGDAFISAIRAWEDKRPRGVQLVIETHSEHLLNRLQRRIAEGELRKEEVAIYFSTPGPDGSKLEELELNEYGDITNWPENFFGDEMADLVARAQAAAERKKKK